MAKKVTENVAVMSDNFIYKMQIVCRHKVVLIPISALAVQCIVAGRRGRIP